MENIKVKIEQVEAPMLLLIKLEQSWRILCIPVREEVIGLIQKAPSIIAYDTWGSLYKPFFSGAIIQLFKTSNYGRL